MDFEYDENKNIKNKEKHNIAFTEAELLWNDKNALVVPVNISNKEKDYAKDNS